MEEVIKGVVSANFNFKTEIDHAGARGAEGRGKISAGSTVVALNQHLGDMKFESSIHLDVTSGKNMAGYLTPVSAPVGARMKWDIFIGYNPIILNLDVH